jgi:predicted DNA-binding transcriptional regulator AlpA
MEGQFFDEKRLAGMLCVSLPAVRRWRYMNTGPKFVKFGSAVRYSATDVTAWIASRPTGGGK